jgi:hypothetical protein
MIGKLKAIFDRQRSYLTSLNFVMISFLFLKDAGWNWWYLLIIPFWIVFAYIDVRYILPKEIDYLHRKSPVLKELLKK